MISKMILGISLKILNLLPDLWFQVKGNSIILILFLFNKIVNSTSNANLYDLIFLNIFFD